MILFARFKFMAIVIFCFIFDIIMIVRVKLIVIFNDIHFLERTNIMSLFSWAK